ncbi:MAG: endonuclease V [Deltaproteobacteria bacterium]|nr:endonuclease V [Deltaproteobacteria bacterium]MBW2308164.1 endonuclease V [Deltaproteobacteria bacterium]
MQLIRSHPWRVTPRQASEIQLELKKHLIPQGQWDGPGLIAAADASYSRRSGTAYAAVVVLRWPGLETVETSSALGEVAFPYVPGLLTFREGPVLIDAFVRLRCRPDVIIFDGQGIAHPRCMGLAAHMGVLLDTPTIGCAKSRLVGEHKPPGPVPGDWAALMLKGRVVGAVLRTRRRVKPVFVSPGHRLGLETSIRIVMNTCTGYRLPEPLRRAHLLVNTLRAGNARTGLNSAPKNADSGRQSHLKTNKNC